MLVYGLVKSTLQGGNADAEIDMYAGYQTELSDGCFCRRTIHRLLIQRRFIFGWFPSIQYLGSFGDLTLSHTIGQDDYLDYSLVSYNLMTLWMSRMVHWILSVITNTISKSFELPLGLDAVASYVDFTADSGSNAVDEDAFVVRVSKSF